MTILYINNEHCKDFAHLKNYFKNHLSNSDIYAELLEDSRDGEITKFLKELGEQELVSLIGTIDQDLCDHDYMNQLTAIITGNKQSIKKPHYSKFFILEKASYKRKNKEVTVSLKINILEHVNEDYIIHIVTSFGFDAIKINTSKIDDDSITEHISFPNCKKEFSGNIKIDDEKIISNIPNINRTGTNENHQSITSNTTSEKKLPLVKLTPNALHYTNNEPGLGNGFVDLGLSVLWASCNLGATSPEMTGDYYLKHELTNLRLMKYGVDGQLPSEANFNELEKCTIKISYLNNEKVCEVIGPNGNKIYFPIKGYKEHKYTSDIKDYQRGYYWSRTAGSYDTLKCWVTDKHMTEFRTYLSLVRMVRAKNEDSLKAYLRINDIKGSIVGVNQAIAQYYNTDINTIYGLKLPYIIKKAITMPEARWLKSHLETLGAIVDIESADEE